MHTQICMQTLAHIHTLMYACIHTHAQTQMHTHGWMHTHTCNAQTHICENYILCKKPTGHKIQNYTEKLINF